MKKYIAVFLTSCFIISCSSSDQYVYENVGTTRAMVVVEKAPAKTNPKVAEAAKVTPAPATPAPAPKKQLELSPKKKVAVKKTPAFNKDDMGTQDSDWVDIVVDEVSYEAPKSRHVVPKRGKYMEGHRSFTNQCPNCSSCGTSSCCKKQSTSKHNSNVRRTLRRVRSLPR